MNDANEERYRDREGGIERDGLEVRCAGHEMRPMLAAVCVCVCFIKTNDADATTRLRHDQLPQHAPT